MEVNWNSSFVHEVQELILAWTMSTDSKPMVAYAKHLGTPVILVSINYRVNIFGFAYFKATNKLPRTICNLGLHDQKLALRWVKRNIAEFGGDPQKITIFGESAGAISVHAHMQCPYSPILGEDEALFWRVIMQSGSLYTSPPAPPAAIQGLTRRVCAEVGIGYDDIDDAVERLRVVPPDQLLEVLLKLSVTVMWVTDDSEVSGGGVLFARGKRDWRDCNYGDWFNGVMLGDVEHEVSNSSIR